MLVPILDSPRALAAIADGAARLLFAAPLLIPMAWHTACWSVRFGGVKACGNYAFLRVMLRRYDPASSVTITGRRGAAEICIEADLAVVERNAHRMGRADANLAHFVIRTLHHLQVQLAREAHGDEVDGGAVRQERSSSTPG